ncbi:hypothetical protein Tco_1213955 [Tanacetum coccineum]
MIAAVDVLGRKKSFKVNKVTTRSRAKTSEDASKSPQTTCKSSMKAGKSGEVWMVQRELSRGIFILKGIERNQLYEALYCHVLSDFQEPECPEMGHEAYGRVKRGGRGGRGEWSGGSGESNAAMGEGSDGMGQRAGGRAQRGRGTMVNADVGITCAQPIASVSPIGRSREASFKN